MLLASAAMELRPGYKRTEVGVIPEEWRVRTIGQIFRLVNGCAFKPVDWKQSGTPIIRIQNLNDQYAPFNYSQAPVAEANRVEPGDLLFAWSGTIGSSFGARLWAGPSGVLNQHIFKVHMNQDEITLPFSLLVFARVEDDIAKQAHGFKASFLHVKKSDLEKVSLPVPSLPEQEAIAEALGDTNALIESLGQLVAKKRHLKQGAMQELLTGKKRLPGFSGEWETKRLGEIANIKDGTHQTPKYVDCGIPFFSVENVTSGDFTNTKFISETEHRFLTKSFKMEKGDILMTRIGSIGDCKLIDWDVDASFYVSLALLKISNGYSPAFIAHYSNSAYFKKEVELNSLQSAIPRKINLGPISNVKIRIPVDIDEQDAISTALSDVDAEIANLESQLAKTHTLKQGMMQKLLTGEIRLI